jgi:hypothetical protein
MHGGPPGTKSGSSDYSYYTAKNPRLFMNILPGFLCSGLALHDEQQRQKRPVAPRPEKCLC